MNQPRDWVSFWDQPHSIYVNARHFDAHYRDIADGIVALLPGPHLCVLDYGCGEALHADRVAARAAKLYLCESSPNVREHISQRFRADTKIAVIAPDDMARMADGALDMIVANSVVQYLKPGELDALLAQWHRLLAPTGVLIVGDVLPPHSSPIGDAMALLRYAAGNGFFFAALVGLARTVFSDYRAVRAKLGIACYGEAEFLAKLKGAGFVAERLKINLEHNPARMSFRARPQKVTAG